MSQNRFNISRLIQASDFIYIITVIIGIVIAISIEEIAIKLIGASIVILGIVALIAKISQRTSEMVDSKYQAKKESPVYNITVKKDTAATHQVIEDFEDIDKSPSENTVTTFVDEKKDSNLQEDYGFRIIKRPTKAVDNKINNSSSNVSNKNPETNVENEKSTISKANIHNNGSNISVNPAKIESKISETKANDVIQNHLFENTKSEIALEIEELEKSILNPENNKENLQKNEFRRKAIDEHLLNLISETNEQTDEPQKEFQYILSRLLSSVKSVGHTRTSVLLMFNPETSYLKIDAFITDVPDSIRSEKKFKLSNDTISRIIENKKPEILTEINPSAITDLIPYYSSSVNSVSFIGIPIFYGDEVLGVLAADSVVPDAYDSSTVQFMGNLTKIISTLLISFSHKYELLQNSNLLSAINYFQLMIKNDDLSLANINNALISTLVKITDAQTVGVVAYDESKNGWHINALESMSEQNKSLLASHIELDNSLVGKAILDNDVLFLAEVDKNTIKVHAREENINNAYFLVYPLRTVTSTFGAIFIDGGIDKQLTELEYNMLETIISNAVLAIERIHLLNMIKSGSLIDPNTGVLNPDAFSRRLEQDFLMAKDTTISLSLCLFRIDKYASLDPEQYFDRISLLMQNILTIVNKNCKPYYSIGQFDERTFAVVLVNVNLNNAKLWAERVRNEIAISMIEVDGKKFSITASFGIADSNHASNLDNLIQNAEHALQISCETTNIVSIFA